jgi:transposase-like protein
MENYSIRQLSTISGYSGISLTRIKDYWLDQLPEEQFDYANIHYLVCDATYFHKDGCMLNLMDASNQKIISHRYIKKESFKESYPWFRSLKQQGLEPLYITTDGHQAILRAMRLVWPQVRLQRCLYHIQHEGMRWLRSDPKTEAGKELRAILSQLSWIKTIAERNSFITKYAEWLRKYESFIEALPELTVAHKDLKRTIVLINNALPDMFYYLEDQKVHSTTNALEGFHSRLKADYQRHRGLSKEHRISYLNWYCYFKNEEISNTK